MTDENDLNNTEQYTWEDAGKATEYETESTGEALAWMIHDAIIIIATASLGLYIAIQF